LESFDCVFDGDIDYDCDCNHNDYRYHDIDDHGYADRVCDSHVDEYCEWHVDGDCVDDDYATTFALVTIPLLLFFFAGSEDSTVRLWDVSTQFEVAVLEGHDRAVTSVAFDASGKYLASGRARGMTCVGGGDDDSDCYFDGAGAIR
jgi:WD40 repeat protein